VGSSGNNGELNTGKNWKKLEKTGKYWKTLENTGK